jgi:uncharacterized membrane protein
LAVASLPLDLATAGACHVCPRPFAGDDLGAVQGASNPDCQGQSPATTYTFQTVDFPGKDFNNSSQLTWVNDAGLTCQQYFLPGQTEGWGNTAVLMGDTWTVINVPGSTSTGGSNPNARGQIALTYGGTDNIYHLALWERGRFTLVPDLTEYVFGGSQAINDRGQITALVYNSSGIGLGFVGTFEHYKVFAYPGADVTFTLAFMTTDSGTTVGEYLDTAGWHAFVFDGKDFSTLGVNGGVNSAASAINNEGDIVGIYWNSSVISTGFELVKGNVTQFVVPNALQTVPDMITDNHLISGTYQAADGTWHGFVATPSCGR